jgi:hypothetical protein
MMNLTESPEEPDRGTPRDYSESMYRFHVELADNGRASRQILEAFLPRHIAIRLVELDYGYEVAMPIQVAPDLVRHLVQRNVAVYQLARLGPAEGLWRTPQD